MSIENPEIQKQKNQEAFKKEFWDLEWNKDVLDKLWGNFEWDLWDAWWKAFRELTQWKFWAMDPKKQEELGAIEKSILEEAWNDPKKMISLLTEAKDIIETAEWSAANKNQADLDKSNSDIQKNNKDAQTWRDSLSKMRNDAIAANDKNSKDIKEAQIAWKNEQALASAESWAKLEAFFDNPTQTV